MSVCHIIANRCGKVTRNRLFFQIFVELCIELKSDISLDTSPNGQNYTIDVKILKIVDGDTVHAKPVDSMDKSTIKVRLSGIDAPEMNQPYGKESANKLMIIISHLNENSTFRLLVLQKDVYGRSLATIMHGDVDINK